MIRGREERLRGLDLKWEDGEMVRWAGRWRSLRGVEEEGESDG
jgi:hypothetical protein